MILFLFFIRTIVDACSQLGCDAQVITSFCQNLSCYRCALMFVSLLVVFRQRSFASTNVVPQGTAVKVVWALSGTLSTPLSIDSNGFLYSATRGSFVFEICY